jgi:AraC-like DNA-binding protein
MRHGLLARAAEKPACELCDAGLQEAAVPLRVGGIPAGFFLFGGTPPSKPKPPTVHRAHHLLRHHGVDFGEDRLESLLEGSKITPSETMQACVRIVQLAARQIALKLTDRLADPRATLPPTVRKACAHIQAHARSEDLRLEDVATHCGVSAGHLSRTFHHATGLTFREYLTRVRVEHAAGLVLRSQRRITDIAYESGFQSLSQFHRAFRKAHGVPPRKLRAGRKA